LGILAIFVYIYITRSISIEQDGIRRTGTMTAQHPTEKPPGYSVPDESPPKRRWWTRKRVWIPALVLVLLAVIGIVIGAVYGVKNTKTQYVYCRYN
jgi:ABC-type Fe3+ transport system permease subunit